MPAQRVVGLRSTSTLSIMLGMFRVDVGIMPTHDKVGSKRPTRNNLCPEHDVKLKQGPMMCPVDGKSTHVVRVPVKGVEYPSKGKYVIIEDGEFEALKAASDAIIEISHRVDWIDPKSVEQTYFVWPSDETWGRYFRVLYDHLRENDYAVGGNWNEEGTIKPVLFRYDDQTKCLVMYVTKYAVCLRETEGVLISGSVENLPNPPEGAGDMMDTIIMSLPDHVEEDVRDVLGERMWALVEAKATGAVIEDAKVNDIRLERRDDLLEALRQTASVYAGKKTKPRSPAKEKVSKKKTAT